MGELIQLLGSGIPVTASTLIAILIWLFYTERKEKNEWIKRYTEKVSEYNAQAQVHADQMASVTRTLDRVLASKAIVLEDV